MRRKGEVTTRAGPHTRLSAGTGLSACSCRLLVTDRVADASRRADQFAFVRVIHFAPQMPDVDIYNGRRPVEALIPDMLDDHCARNRAPGAGHQIFERADLEMPYLVADRVSRSEDKNRDVYIPLSNLSQRIGPTQSGQHQI